MGSVSRRLPDAIELDISVYPFDKVGDFAYPPRQSSQFSAAEIAHMRHQSVRRV
jgi:hypothetical protein